LSGLGRRIRSQGRANGRQLARQGFGEWRFKRAADEPAAVGPFARVAHTDPQGHGQSDAPTAQLEVQDLARLHGAGAQQPDARGGKIPYGDPQRHPPPNTR
jgi:hypothetical protein